MADPVKDSQSALSTVSSRFLMVGGLVIIAACATSHDWKVYGGGSAGILEGCGCREVNNNCNYGGGGGGNPLFKGTMCNNYNTVRAFAIMAAGFLFIATSLLTYRESWFFRASLRGAASAVGVAKGATDSFARETEAFLPGSKSPGMSLKDRQHEQWVSRAGQVFLFGSWVSGLIATAMFGSLIKDTGTASDIQYGFWIFLAGWVMVFIFAGVYLIPYFGRYFKGVENIGGRHIAVSMFIHWWLIFALALLAVGVASSHWASPKVHGEHVLVPDFELVVQDMHNNTGTNRSLTNIDDDAATLITPNVGVGDCDKDLAPENCPNKKMVFGLWDICLCKEIKPKCKWAGTRLFTGGNCDTFEASQYFVWFTLGFAALSFMPYTFGFLRTWWLPIVGPLSMTVICGIVAASTFGAAWDQEKGHKGDIDGWAYIGFVVGVGGFFLGGIIAGWTEVAKEGTWISGVWDFFKKRP
jgi:hypothetical protein